MNAPQLLDIDDSVLLVVDMQTRLSASMPAEAWAGARDGAILLARAAGELELPVIATRQYPRGLGDTDADVAAALPEHTVTVDKTCFSASGADSVREALAMTGRSQVVICGMETHVCVLQTAVGLTAHGWTAFVVTDAVCSRAEAHRENALARLRAGGVVVTNGESCLFEWLRDARHERFKAVSALLRS